jgi:hypothetical protein
MPDQKPTLEYRQARNRGIPRQSAVMLILLAALLLGLAAGMVAYVHVFGPP